MMRWLYTKELKNEIATLEILLKKLEARMETLEERMRTRYQDAYRASAKKKKISGPQEDPDDDDEEHDPNEERPRMRDMPPEFLAALSPEERASLNNMLRP